MSLRKELDELSDVFTLQNNLQAARERRASNREALSRTEQSIVELRERLEKLNRELDSTEDATASIVTLKEHIADLQEQQAKQQRQRDVDMEQRGTLRAIRERETRLRRNAKRFKQRQKATVAMRGYTRPLTKRLVKMGYRLSLSRVQSRKLKQRPMPSYLALRTTGYRYQSNRCAT